MLELKRKASSWNKAGKGEGTGTLPVREVEPA